MSEIDNSILTLRVLFANSNMKIYGNAIDLAIQALEKQLPKKCFDEIDFGKTCRVCRAPHNEGLYCSACGQRLE